MTQENTESLGSNQGSLWEKVRGRTGKYNQKHNQNIVSCFVSIFIYKYNQVSDKV